MSTTFEKLSEAIINGEKDKLLAAVDDALKEGVNPSDIIDKGMSPGMKEVGERFARYEIYLPEMMMAARAMKAVMAKLEPEFAKSAMVAEKKGTVVIGTVEGDMHEIGKDIVITLLQVQGFEVVDLGIDVNALDFVKEAEKVRADIIGASSLMTTTMPNQKELHAGKLVADLPHPAR